VRALFSIAGSLKPLALGLAVLTATCPFVGTATAQDEPTPRRPATAAEWKRVKKLLPKHLWLNDTKKRKKAKVDARWTALNGGRWTLTRSQYETLGTILRAGSPYTSEKKRALTIDVPTGSESDDGAPEVLPVRVAITTKYKPECGRSFPLIVTLHGGPIADVKTAAASGTSGLQLRLWKGFTSTLHCIVAAPALTGSEYGEREWTFLANLIDDLDRRYNVDRDRILLTGHSWGGILTWHLGPPHADRFALLAPFVCAVNPGEEHLSNLMVLPVHHVQGKHDIEWILRTGRERRDVLDELEYEHTYVEANGGHESFGTEIAKIAKAFADVRRDLYAPRITRVTVQPLAPGSL